ncbi:MAG: chromosome segregation ATPase [Cyanobacteria bacterium P01_A01_bin.45]
MTERDIPEDWLPATTAKPDNMSELSRTKKISHVNDSNESNTNNSKSVKWKKQTESKKNEAKTYKGGLPRWIKSWTLWALLLTLVPGAVSFMAMAMLFKLPSAPNCPSIFWPLASASVRMHCAQLAASKQTVNDLLQAIALVEHLPKNHPLRSEIDRSLKVWSSDILRLADENFQVGRLDQAIATAKRIPEDLPAYKLVEEKIADWRGIWTKAEGHYQDAEDHMREERWHQAFMTAAKLLRVDNKFWASTKYEELNNLVSTAREDGKKLVIAKDLAKSKNVDNVLKAIKLVQSVSKNSYVYQKAQELVPEFGRQMLDLAEAKMAAKDADEAIYIAQRIPDIVSLQADIDDFVALAEAQRSAWTGSVAGLELAISQAQQIDSTRSNYDKAQQLITRWQLEIQDVARLEKARILASQGTVTDLNAAIAEARLIPASNPRHKEARQEIYRWRSQAQTIQDRPYLDRAEQLALLQDPNSLQAAISEASRIGRGRALYKEARQRISQWRASIERTEDQPYLDQARSLAQTGSLEEAISTARQISRGRALSREARREIRSWRSRIAARENWQQAREVALRGTAKDLSRAIRLARKIPRNSILRGDANPAIDQWSQQLLDIARSQGISNLEQAIETANLVPRGTSAYSAARRQIREWRNLLNPEPEPEPQEEQFNSEEVTNTQ